MESKQEQHSKDFERKWPKCQDEGGGSCYCEMLGMLSMDTGRVTPDHYTGRARQFDNAAASQIEGICNRHTN
jgi:hypothetical protein